MRLIEINGIKEIEQYISLPTDLVIERHFLLNKWEQYFFD
jgi:hypothetical protein